jgi:hypothetical protein
MRKLLLAGAALAAAIMSLAAATPATATEYPWCAQYTGSHYGWNCGFVSQGQCLAAVHGVGGFCRQNPWFLAAGYSRRVR